MIQVFLLAFCTSDHIVVLKKGRKIEYVAACEPGMKDSSVEQVAKNIAAFFGVKLRTLTVPNIVTNQEEWMFQDGVDWLEGKLRQEAKRAKQPR